MGLIHSTPTNREEPSSPNDLRLVRLEVEKLFAMDSHHHHSNSNKNRLKSPHRWNILRFLDHTNRDIQSDVTTTATSSCSSSPIFPHHHHHHNRRRLQLVEDEDSYETNLSHRNDGIRKSQRRDLKESKVSTITSTVVTDLDEAVRAVTNNNRRYSRSTLDDSTHITTGNNVSSIPTPNGRSRPIPVTRRRVSPMNMMIHNEEKYHDEGGNDDDDDAAAEEHRLKQIYDLRTWEMYIRISEARKKAACAQSKQHQWLVTTNTSTRNSSCITNTSTAATGITTTTTNALIPISTTTTLIPTSTLQLPQCQPFHNSRSIHMIPFLPKEETLGVEPSSSSLTFTSPVSEHEMIFGDLDD